MTTSGDGLTATRQNALAAAPRRPDSVAKRVLASIIFIPCLVIIARRGGYYYLALIDIMILIGMWEFYKMMEAKGLRPYKTMGILSGLALSWYMFFQQGVYANLLMSVIFIGIMALELARRDKGLAVYHVSVTVFGVFYVAWLGSHLILLRELPHLKGLDYSLGFSFVIMTFAITWCYDTGAYFVGSWLGRRQILPSVSPGKTYEGAIGGVLCSVVGMLVCRATIAPYMALLPGIALAIVTSIVGQFGDLSESMIKRDAKIKDSSKTIPGHGGVLDRFDSLLFTAPLIYYVLKYVIFS
ncbi:MAG: phosphatidate cytidylyltransferase [Candidatus Krumholzibacteria bacterium]|nr:phosphatidate cytidylyltransferase [Candidatus Krumholzibacteria bacterium]